MLTPEPDLLVPPPFPTPGVYTSAYCEENVYKLVERFAEDYPDWKAMALFVSNRSKTVRILVITNYLAPLGERLI
jgi:hypothetical protein